MGEKTVFDKILAGEIPCTRVYEDDAVLAIKDIQPAAPIHVVVIPKRKIMSFSEVRDQAPPEMGEFLIGVSKAAEALNLDNDGYRIVFNHGAHGQQTVDYIHAHILGGRQLSWPPG